MRETNKKIAYLLTIITAFALMITPMAAFEEGETDTSVSNQQQINGATVPDTDPVTGDINVNGWIGIYDGETDPEVPQPPEESNAWINVTIPKTVFFGSLATDDGRVYGPNYKITNNSTKAVEVHTSELTETTANISGISNKLDVNIVSGTTTLPILKSGPEYLGTDFTGATLATIAAKGNTNFTLSGTFSGAYPEAGTPAMPTYKLVLQFKLSQ